MRAAAAAPTLRCEHAERIEAAATEVLSANTRRAYATAWRAWSAWCTSERIEPLPAQPGHGHVLTPGRSVGAAPQDDDGEPLAEKMTRLAAQWREQRAAAEQLDAEIEANRGALGF